MEQRLKGLAQERLPQVDWMCRLGGGGAAAERLHASFRHGVGEGETRLSAGRLLLTAPSSVTLRQSREVEGGERRGSGSQPFVNYQLRAEASRLREVQAVWS